MDQNEASAENALTSDLVRIDSGENTAVIRALLERLIDCIPRDPQGRVQCFNTICRFFHRRGLIDYNNWPRNECESIELLIQGWLNRRVGSYDIESDRFIELKYPPQYLQNFIELGKIGEGGFGKVYKAKHKWDGVEYAIKKIRISERSCKRYLEEAKILAMLNHPNIVPYKAAWVEELCKSPERKKRSKQAKQSVVISFSLESELLNHLSLTSKKDNSSSDLEIVFESSAGHANEDEVEASRDVYEKRSIEALSSSFTSNSSTPTSKPATITLAVTEPKSLLLYIQMSLCRCTLREWLTERNDQKPPVPESSIRTSALQIFVQLLRALKYIHAKKIIHHDIKPKNIFISNDDDGLVVQLGDFGLACSLQKTVHNDVKGTDLYVAPEQLQGMCNVKSDMYSLGIVLFELLNTFHTNMERFKELRKWKCQKRNEEVVSEETSLETVAATLTMQNPNLRPSAATLLEIFETRAQSDRIKELLRETKELKRLILEKDQEIESLRDLLRQHEISFL